MNKKILIICVILGVCSQAIAGLWTANKTAITDDDVFFFQDTGASTPKLRDGYISALNLKGYINYPGTLTYTANASPSAANIFANKFITNYGATGTITVTMPAVCYEISRAIVVESAQIIQVTPPSGEAFDLSGTTLTTDQSFAGPATVGSKIVITRQRNAAGTWIWSVDAVRGTWAGI